MEHGLAKGTQNHVLGTVKELFQAQGHLGRPENCFAAIFGHSRLKAPSKLQLLLFSEYPEPIFSSKSLLQSYWGCSEPNIPSKLLSQSFWGFPKLKFPYKSLLLLFLRYLESPDSSKLLLQLYLGFPKSMAPSKSL